MEKERCDVRLVGELPAWLQFGLYDSPGLAFSRRPGNELFQQKSSLRR